jgi:hypothetical protein
MRCLLFWVGHDSAVMDDMSPLISGRGSLPPPTAANVGREKDARMNLHRDSV